jgi:DNA polymerase-3 subunit delta
MNILKAQDFSKLISSQKISPVYLLAGEEFYFINMCLNEIEKLTVSEGLNREVFYASESSADDILNALQTTPFLNETRVVIVKAVNKMKAVDAEELSGYLSNIIESSCLILLYFDNYKKETVAERKEFINKCIASKNCVSVNCRKQYENEVREFIKNEFAQKGKESSYEVISRIIEENGTDLLNISNETEKLSLFVGKNKKDITQEDLEKISGYTKEINVYALSSEIEAKDLKKAMFVLENLLTEREEPVAILSAISSAVRKMLTAKSMLEEQGLSIAETASILRIHNFFVKTFFTNLKKHSTNTLKESLKTILKTDAAIKTGTNDAASALEKTIISICNC